MKMFWNWVIVIDHSLMNILKTKLLIQFKENIALFAYIKNFRQLKYKGHRETQK